MVDVPTMRMYLTGQTMCLIKAYLKWQIPPNAGAIQTAIVEIKYISSNNVAIFGYLFSF